MKARYFTYGEKPKAVYYLTDIKSDVYPNHSAEDFFAEIKNKWLTNPDVIIVDDRDSSYSSGDIEISQIEKYLQKLEEIKNQLEEDDEEKA
jgi:hypothetical protein